MIRRSRNIVRRGYETDGEEEAVEAPVAGTIDGLASMIAVRVVVVVLPHVSVAT
jgi:hypothetical protein